MNQTEASDEELIKLICEDHWGAFEELYKRYSARLYTFFKKRISDEQAQDLTQASFMKIHDRANTFNPHYPAAAWIFTVAKNLLNDEFRKIKRHANLNEVYQDEFELKKSIDTYELWAELQPHIEELDEKQKNVIIWRYREGRDFTEIASFLSTTQSNARQLVSRAIRSLKVLTSNEETRED